MTAWGVPFRFVCNRQRNGIALRGGVDKEWERVLVVCSNSHSHSHWYDSSDRVSSQVFFVLSLALYYRWKSFVLFYDILWYSIVNDLTYGNLRIPFTSTPMRMWLRCNWTCFISFNFSFFSHVPLFSFIPYQSQRSPDSGDRLLSQRKETDWSWKHCHIYSTTLDDFSAFTWLSTSLFVSFIRAVRDWPALDMVIQCDIVKCFDRIDHNLLLSFLSATKDNQWIVDLTFSRIFSKGQAQKRKELCFPVPGHSPRELNLTWGFIGRSALHFCTTWIWRWKRRKMVGSTPLFFFFYERYADDMLCSLAFPKEKGRRWARSVSKRDSNPHSFRFGVGNGNAIGKPDFINPYWYWIR